jgi:hypothetical protein
LVEEGKGVCCMIERLGIQVSEGSLLASAAANAADEPAENLGSARLGGPDMDTMTKDASAHPTAMRATTSVLKPETSIEVGWQLEGRA